MEGRSQPQHFLCAWLQPGICCCLHTSSHWVPPKGHQQAAHGGSGGRNVSCLSGQNAVGKEEVMPRHLNDSLSFLFKFQKAGRSFGLSRNCLVMPATHVAETWKQRKPYRHLARMLLVCTSSLEFSALKLEPQMGELS